MERILDTLVEAQQTSDFCHICSAKLQHKNIAEVHYNSKRHKDNVKTFRVNTLDKLKKNRTIHLGTSEKKITRNETVLCDICNVRVDIKSIQKHLGGDDHKKNEEAYCFPCAISTMSKEQLWEHTGGSKHKKKLEELNLPPIDGPYSPTDNMLPDEVTKLMLQENCQLCKTRFPTLCHAVDHYRAPRHKRAVQKWLQEKETKQKSGSQKNEANQSKTAGVKNVVQEKTEGLPSKIVNYKCYVCKIDIHDESRNTHTNRFPHKELIRLKIDMVSQGIGEEYWYRQGNTILCLLCNTQICTFSEANEHFITTNHYTNFNKWCKNLDANKTLSESETKWFYCRVCEKRLDGTGNAAEHYQGRPHLGKINLYCKICEVPNATPELLEIHMTTTLHKEKFAKSHDTVDKEATHNLHISTRKHISNSENSQEINETPKSNIENKTLKFTSASDNLKTSLNQNSSLSLKEQVFQEIEKIVQSLYYSKKVPYDVALEHLKNFNEEIEELTKKCEKREYKNKSELAASGVQFDNNCQSFSGKSELSENDPQLTFDLIDFSDDMPTILSQKDDIRQKEPQHEVNFIDFFDTSNIPEGTNSTSMFESNNVEQSSTAVNKEYGTTRQEINKEVDDVVQKEHFFLFGERNKMDTMLEEIVQLRKKVEDQYRDEDNIEKDLLAEIEKLIVFVNGKSLPPDIILSYLQSFNSQIDKCLAKQSIKYKYTKEELMSLRTENTFTERLNINLRMILNSTRIWNKIWNDLDLD